MRVGGQRGWGWGVDSTRHGVNGTLGGMPRSEIRISLSYGSPTFAERSAQFSLLLSQLYLI